MMFRFPTSLIDKQVKHTFSQQLLHNKIFKVVQSPVKCIITLLHYSRHQQPELAAGQTASWYSGHGLWLLHRRTRFGPNSSHGNLLGKWNLCPAGSTHGACMGHAHALQGKFGNQSKGLTGHWLTYMVSIIARKGFLVSCNATKYT